MRMVDRTGRVVDVPDAEAQAAYQSGKLGFLKGDMIPMVSPDGQVGRVRAEDAPQAFEAGARAASPEEEHKAYLEAEHGGAGNAIAAAGLGLARGLTLGASDYVARGIAGPGHAGREVQRYLREQKEAHPIASGAGEVAGLVGPALIPGADAGALAEGGRAIEGIVDAARLAREGSKAAEVGRAVGALPRGLSALGRATEEGVGHLLGEAGTSLPARVGRAAVTKGAGAAAEGAVFGVANELDEDSLGDHETNGEKLFAAAAHGALMGGLLGGGVGAVGEVGKAVLSKAAPAIQKFADREAFRATSARKAFTEAAERIPGGVEGVGAEMKASGIIKPFDTVEAIAPRARAAANEAGAEVRSTIQRVEAAGVEGPTIGKYLKKVDADIVSPLAKMQRTNAPQIRAVESLMRDFMEYAGAPAIADASDVGLSALDPAALETRASLTKLHDFRQRLDDMIRWQKSNPLAPTNLTNETLKRLRGLTEDAITSTVDKAAPQLGEDVAAKYAADKLRFRRLSIAALAAEDSVSRAQANASFSLTDKMSGIAGAAAGIATHGPVGLAQGIAMGAISKAVRTRGNATAAIALDKLASLATVERAVRNVDTKVEAGVKGFLNPGERPRIRIRTFGGDEERAEAKYARERAAIAALAANPAAIEHVTKSRLGDIEEHAPKTSAQYQETTRRAVAFLSSKLPPQAPTSPLTKLTPPPPSDEQVHSFLLYLEAVKNPTTILDDMRAGTLTPQQVEAVKAVYPRLYAQVQRQIMDQVADPKTKLDYNQRISLGVLFGVETDPTLAPDVIRSMQSIYAGQDAKQQGPKAPRGRLHPPDLASASDRIGQESARHVRE